MLTRDRNRYTCGPTVAVEKKLVVEVSTGEWDTKFVHDMSVCHDCRLKRYVDAMSSSVSIQLLFRFYKFLYFSDSMFHFIEPAAGIITSPTSPCDFCVRNLLLVVNTTRVYNAAANIRNKSLDRERPEERGSLNASVRAGTDGRTRG